MRGSSFKAQYRLAPLRAGTPPPPAYEPLSPIVDRSRYPRSSPSVAYNPPLRSAPLPRSNPQYSPALASPIDALADAAVSSLHASPAYVESSRPPSYGPASPATAVPPPHERLPKRRYFDDALQAYEERPSKRARSEFFPSPRQGQQYSRPATSHIPGWSYNIEQMMDNGVRMYQDNGIVAHHPEDSSSKRLSDAQLLLDFHHAVSASHGGTELHVSTSKRWSIPHPNRPEQHNSQTADPISQYLEPSYPDGNRFDYSSRPMDCHYTGPADPHSISTADANPVAQAVQTHTPPEEIFMTSLPPTIPDVNAEEDKKSKKHQGWPKGKPRGPRQTTAAGKRKKSTLKLKNTTNPVTSRPVDQLHSPQSLPADRNDVGQVEEAPPVSELGQPSCDLASHTRRHSLSIMFAPIHYSAISSSAFPRAQSVPLNTVMTITPLADQASSSTAHTHNSASQMTVCAGCNSSDSHTVIGEGEQWISCDGCKGWFHFVCAGFKSEREVRDVDKFYCGACSPEFGKTTKVRKSGRAHTAVDYAGLNEGILKTSDDNPEHHYIQAFKNGGLQFDQETFARLPPELVTAEYLEKTNGFKEPIVIPETLNPRPKFPNSSSPSSNSNIVQPSESSQGLFSYEMALDDGQDKIDMVIPQGLTVRRVAELYGPLEKVDVIDVKSQEGEDKRWNMAKWADYYEQEGEKPVRNVISLEVSQSKLGRLIRRPKAVRDMDLQDDVWPEEDKANAPKVQFYCLMSVADCYTDFHIDFGGSSVYYHIIKGKKTFFFIPPTKQNLKKYEDWCLSPKQGHEFLGQQVKECYKVDLSAGDTMLIPSGWIHAVWTPEDSLVIGGNFLTRIHYGMQIQVAEIEKNTKVAKKFRYPYFQKVMWLAVIKYLEQDPLPPSIEETFLSGGMFQRPTPVYCEPNKFGHNSDLGPANYNKRYYSKAELDGVPQLAKYIWKTIMISLGRIEGITKETKNAVTRSIPKSHGDPLVLARRFAMWVAWKRGNEPVPQWGHPDTMLPETMDSRSEKKLSAAQLKRLERDSWSEAIKAARERPPRATRAAEIVPRNIAESPLSIALGPMTPVPKQPRPHIEPAMHLSTPKTSQLGPKRIACDACRKRRIRCKHKDELIETSPGSGFGIPPNSALHSLSGSSGNFLGFPLKRRVSEADTSFGPLLNATGAPEGMATVNVAGYPSDGNADNHAIKSGRVKACPDCRKSKRRCIHDENGNVDPIKASEAPVPRGSASKKRRVSEGDTNPASRDLKNEPLADFEMGGGEWNPENLIETPSRPKRLVETSDRINVYSSQKVVEYTSIEDPMELDNSTYLSEADGDTITVAVSTHLPDGNSVLSSIEDTSEQSTKGVAITVPDVSHINCVEPHTPGSPANTIQNMLDDIGPSQRPSVSPAYSNITVRPHISATPHLSWSTRGSSGGRKTSHTPRPLTAASTTPKSAAASRGRQDSKEGSIKGERKSQAISPGAKDEDHASLALALQLQMEEHGLRRRSK
ncbi:uncharacterized protein BDR25DRAFT_275202 [Lindgomyces ingoldianus]|uniref:Uncharacterized protein n=1 Tax=Lindgomyces ingoldianus TaxID=673940 RepID=A0ACB6RF13_9PLEO|nr:uncharacterized protein BDR25DRAFT_275202 [Lindgomyces ingoldianus]KAF2477796.1 hypothetical protein BDR25DRAFT_275202 [Lindgomyces ingoldianus]